MSAAAPVVAGVVVLGGVIVLTRAPLERIAFFLVGALVTVITWNGLRAAGGAAANGLFVLAWFAVLANAFVRRERVLIPPWLLAAAAGLVVAALLVVMFPVGLGIENRTELQFNQAFVAAGVAITRLGGPRSNMIALIKWEIALVLIPVMIAVVATTPWRVTRLLDLWTVGALINAFCGIASYAGIRALSPHMLGNRSAGLTIHPNYLALTAVLAIPTALRWAGRSRRGNLAALGATLLLLGGEYTTGSRDGSVSAAVCVVLCFVLMPRLRPMLRKLIVPALAAVLAVLVFTHAGSHILNQLRLGGGIQSAIGSDNERAIAKHVAEAQISARPITGVGFAVDSDAQNIYLQILASGGLIAMAAMVVFVGGLAGCVRRALRGPLREDAIALGVCLAIFLVNGYYDSQLPDKYLYVLPGVLLACARITTRMRAPAPIAQGGAIAAGTPAALTPGAAIPSPAAPPAAAAPAPATV